MEATAKSILAYTDKRSRRVEFCGTMVTVVAPTIGAMDAILGKALQGRTSGAPGGLDDPSTLASCMVAAFPDLAIHCIREAANPHQHVFEDTEETRRMLRDVPYDEALKIITTLSELMGVDKKTVEAEVKNS